MTVRVGRVWFLITLLVLGTMQVSAVGAGPCCGSTDARATDSCCIDVVESSCPCCADESDERDNRDEPCSGCECPLGLVAGAAPALVAVERAQERMSEEVIAEFALWSRTLTPRVVQLDLLRPPKA